MDAQRLRIGPYNVKDYVAPSQGQGVREAKSIPDDVLALQEVGSKKLLEKFVAERLGGAYKHLAWFPATIRAA